MYSPLRISPPLAITGYGHYLQLLGVSDVLRLLGMSDGDRVTEGQPFEDQAFILNPEKGCSWLQ